MFLLIVQRIYLKSLCIKLAKVHLEGTGMGLPGIRHEDLKLVSRVCLGHMSHINAAGRYLTIPQTCIHLQVFYVYPHTMCGVTAKVYLSAYMQSLVLTFKDLRFLGSYLKAKRPLIYWVSQLFKRPERQTPAFLFGETWGIVLSVHYVGPHPLPDHLYYLWGFT